MLKFSTLLAKRGTVAALFLLALVVPNALSPVHAEENPVRARTPLTIEMASGQEVYLDVELALTGRHRSLGLMFRRELSDDKGMLFIFPDMGMRSFWMRNCYISLDIIYLDEDGSIINIIANAPPQSDTPRRSTAPAKAVLEIRGGLSSELGLKSGDIVRHVLLRNMKTLGK